MGKPYSRCCLRNPRSLSQQSVSNRVDKSLSIEASCDDIPANLASGAVHPFAASLDRCQGLKSVESAKQLEW